jgi:hypothetical protein
MRRLLRPLSFAKIPFACEINSIRIVFHRSCEVPSASCSASFLSFLVAFAVLFNSDRGCYSKIWSCGGNSPSSSGSILGRDSTRPTNSFGIAIRGFWSRWKQSLIVVSPDTVVRWYRTGFALYWRALSRARRVVGRKRISKGARDVIFRMNHRQSKLGCATHSRRAADAWLRGFRANGLSMDEASAASS